MTVELYIGGNKFTRWMTLEVSRSITSIAAQFTCNFKESAPYGQRAIWGVRVGDLVKIKMNGYVICLGWVDSINGTGGDGDPIWSFSGREVTCDLVDCMRDDTKNEWKDATLYEIVQELCAPFDQIAVEVDSNAITSLYAHDRSASGDYRFKKIAYTPGDTIFNFIAKLCKQRGILPVFDYGEEDYGTLWLTRAGSEKSDDVVINDKEEKIYWREQGHAALSWSVQESQIDRFSEYTFKAQQGTVDFNVQGSDSIDGVEKSSMTPAGRVKDSAVTRHRPFVGIGESAASNASLEKRAQWEALIRAGKSMPLEYSVKGWAMRDDTPWRLNMRVPIRDHVNGISEERLLETATHIIDENGRMTTAFRFVPIATYRLSPQYDDGDVQSSFDPRSGDPE